MSPHDSETPAKGHQVITVCAFIHNNFNGIEKVFLPKRAVTKKFLPDVFELPGGHIEFGEELIKGLIREIYEEFQMNISIGDPFAAFTYINHIKLSHSVEIIYFAKFIDPLKKIMLNPEDHSKFGWFTEGEIITKVVDENKNADDNEIKAILKGFHILNNHSFNLG